MHHLSEGQLYAYLDHALTPEENSAIEEHLDQCQRCTHKLQALEQRHSAVHASLSNTHNVDANIPSPVLARRRFAAYADMKKEQAMRKGVFAKRYRPAWYAVVILLVFSLSLTIAPVRTLASQFLALFRVQKIQFVELNPYTLPSGFSFEGAAMEIDQFINDTVTVIEHGEAEVVSVEQASELMSFTPRYAEQMGDDIKITALPAFTMTMAIDVEQVQLLFDSLGYSDYTLSNDLDGADIGIEVYSSLSIATPSCQQNRASDCVVLIEMPSPTVSAPSELDVDALGNLYLQLLGMNEKEAADFSRNLDWTTTLVVPVPSSQAKYKTVYIDGEAGTLISSYIADKDAEYMLVWMKDDVIHAIIGEGDSDTAINIARSLSE